MKISDISLPHPILGISDDVDGNFTIEPTVELTKERIGISIKTTLSNPSLEELKVNKKCSYCVEISCQSTLYRKSFLFAGDDIQIDILPRDLLNKVTVQVFIVATDQIRNYLPVGANADYAGASFSLSMGDVMGIGGTFSFVAEKRWQNLKKLASFIVVERNDDIENGPVEYDLSGNRIIIKVSQQDFKKTSDLQLYPHVPEIFHSAIIYPALLHAINVMFLNEESYEDNQWQNYVNQIIECDDELKGLNRTDPDSAVIVAQSILKSPLNRTLEAVESLENDASKDPDNFEE